MHGRFLLDEKKIRCLCLQDPVTVSPAKIYTRNDIVMMETYIAHSKKVSIFQKYKS